MKKLMIIIGAMVIVVIIGISAVTTVFADTVYYYYGYLYSYIDNDRVSLCGWSGDTSELFVPGTINNRDVVDISNRAFQDNTNLTGIRFFQDSILERIGSFAFDGCTGISGEISFPRTLSLIETAAFQGCSSLERVVFNSPIDAIPNQCFNGCSSLSDVSLRDGLISIGYRAFADCPNLTYLQIPASVSSIADTAFQNDEITLGVYYNSYAHQYAMDNGIAYEILDPENIPTEPPTDPPTEPEPEGYLLGDTDDNDDVEVVDATWLQRYIALMNIGVIEDTVMQGDVDGDGDPSIVDAAFIMRYCVGIDTPFDIGELVV